MNSVSILWCTGFFGSFSSIRIYRYDSGNYYIQYHGNFFRTTCKEIERIAPGALSVLRRKAGVREYAVS